MTHAPLLVAAVALLVCGATVMPQEPLPESGGRAA
jgi:hypothetical protein